MSLNVALIHDFGDGEYRFKLAFAELVELEEKRGAGCFTILRRLYDTEPYIADIAEVIRLGLIGGGCDPVAALRLVRTYVHQYTATGNLRLALQILDAALIDRSTDGAATPGEPEPAASSVSTSPDSTPPAP